MDLFVALLPVRKIELDGYADLIGTEVEDNHMAKWLFNVLPVHQKGMIIYPTTMSSNGYGS